MLHNLNRSKIIVSAIAVALLAAFAVFTSISATNLNYAVIQGIDGPLDSRELSALQLSNLLSATAVGVFVGVTFFGLAIPILG